MHADPRSTRRPPRNSLAIAIGGLIAMAAAIGVSRFVYTPILPAMAEALHLTKAEAGLIASANFVGYLMGALLAATVTLPGHRRVWLLGALGVCGVTTAMMGVSESLPVFLALRGIGGAASAFGLVLSSALVLDRLATAGRSDLSPVHFAGVGSGIAVSAVLVSGLLADGAAWQTLWLASGTIALLAVPAVAWLVPSGQPDIRALSGQPSRAASSALPAVRPRGLLPLGIAYGLFGFGYIITATFLVAIVRGSPLLRPAEPLVWLIVGLTAAPSVALWISAGRTVGMMRAFSAACVLEAAGVAASVSWHSVTGIFVAAALLGGTFMGITALGLAGARQLAPSASSRVFALMTAAFGAGQIAGPALAGMLSDRFGGFALPSFLAAGALLAAACIAPLADRRPRA